MHTGQSSIAPESSLPQLGQVRWGSVLMAYRPSAATCAESNTTLHEVMRKAASTAQLLFRSTNDCVFL
jgi:hypothetical protein